MSPLWMSRKQRRARAADRAVQRSPAAGVFHGTDEKGGDSFTLRLHWPSGAEGRERIDFGAIKFKRVIVGGCIWYHFPPPHDDLTIAHGEVLTPQKADAIYVAARTFGALPQRKADA